MAALLFRLYAKGEYRGAGVAVSKRHVLTCAHVVKGAKQLAARRDGELEASAKVVEVSPEGEWDLALLELDTTLGEPPLWLQMVPAGTVNLCGCPGGDCAVRTVPVDVTPHIEGGWAMLLEARAGVPEGMSGGVAMALAGTEARCVGLIQEGGTRALKSIIAGPGRVARFLARRGMRLAGCPEIVPPVDEDEEIRKRYLEKVALETGQIDIRSFQRSDGKASAFAIEDLYIALANHEGKQIEDALRRHRCLVVQGDAGSGKSTFLQHLAHRFAQTGEFFPLPVRVAELELTIRKELAQPRTPHSEEDPRWLAVHLGAKGWGVDELFAMRQLQRPETVVLLDGLDEAPNEARRRVLAKLFSNAAAKFDRCRFVLTTRPGAYAGEAQSRGFAVDNIAPLKPESISQFFTNWSRCVYPGNADAAEALRKDLEEQAGATEEVQKLADNPMMLTALAVIHWNEGRLPQDRGDLYKSIIGWLAKSREKKPGRVAEKECLVRLGALALGMQTWPTGRLKQADVDTAAKILTDTMKARWREAREFLEQETLDSGIVVSRDGGNTVEFKHLTFQEYLAALELKEDRSDPEQEKILFGGRERYGVEWRELLRLLALLVRPSRAQWLYAGLLGAAGDALADRARTVALIRTMAWDRREKEEEIKDGRYMSYVREMAGLFEGKADGEELDLWSRGEAAEAWELLVGDISRLRLPHEEGYWARVNERFDIGRCPVTVYEYGCYMEGCPETEAPQNWEGQQRFPLRPVVGVSWYDAEAYAKWCSGGAGRPIRLPTDDEWYLAAAGEGKKRREYPWGDNEPAPDLANFGYEIRYPTPVGLFPAGATPGNGIVDMGGNVWEWMSNWYDKDQKSKSLRGGSFDVDSWDLRAACRGSDWPDERYGSIGFRCVRDVFA